VLAGKRVECGSSRSCSLGHLQGVPCMFPMQVDLVLEELPSCQVLRDMYFRATAFSVSMRRSVASAEHPVVEAHGRLPRLLAEPLVLHLLVSVTPRNLSSSIADPPAVPGAGRAARALPIPHQLAFCCSLGLSRMRPFSWM